MIWLGLIIGLLIGMAVGAALYRQLMSDTVKVQQLQSELDTLRKDHLSYQHQVHAHFDTSASLFKALTSNYRELYRHLASSAQQLCPETIYQQLEQLGNNQDILAANTSSRQQQLFDENGSFTPPRDYAEKKTPGQKGNLSEDYGLEKVTPGDEASS